MDNNISFKGYDARPLRGVYLRDVGFGRPFYALVKEVAGILNKENVDVFVQTKDGIVKNIFQEDKIQPRFDIWPFAQDRVTFINPKNFLAKGFIKLNENFEAISEFFNANLIKKDVHIEGGNYFFIKEGRKDSVLIGKDEFKLNKFSEIKEYFSGRNFCSVSQPDYHLDLSIRPLNNRNILLNDPGELLNEIRQGIKRAGLVYERNKSPELEKVIKNLEKVLNDAALATEQYELKSQSKTLRQELKYNKFNVIRVPASITEPNQIGLRFNIDSMESRLQDGRKYSLNYLNAVVHERPDKSLVYITNKSNLDEKVGITPEIARQIDFSFEQIFINSLKGIIKPEDIHFVGGEGNFISALMKKSDAGIHCLISEIPQ